MCGTPFCGFRFGCPPQGWLGLPIDQNGLLISAQARFPRDRLVVQTGNARWAPTTQAFLDICLARVGNGRDAGAVGTRPSAWVDVACGGRAGVALAVAWSEVCDF